MTPYQAEKVRRAALAVAVAHGNKRAAERDWMHEPDGGPRDAISRAVGLYDAALWDLDRILAVYTITERTAR
jgi:hypothetical protein